MPPDLDCSPVPISAVSSHFPINTSSPLLPFLVNPRCEQAVTSLRFYLPDLETPQPLPPLPPSILFIRQSLMAAEGERQIERDRGSRVLEGEGENKKEMHGQTGSKWQQSALMETDGRMRR
ncbi:unnamed protein product [Pleuronectes platessa]|uniref:Uncharacterized protein n=1 Tax=Pleuronectes platessa TaxID=8262 RepID=A0A9N7UFX3_PLEPL|nr:unnamed protein product [Pleuronectes platessa]